MSSRTPNLHQPPLGPGRTAVRFLVAPLLAFGLLISGCGRDGGPGVTDAAADRVADEQFIIPLGTGEAMDRGDKVDILPPELQMNVGEILELINEDDRGHLVGPFFVGAGEILRQQFASPGEFQGICTVHPSGQFVLTVV